MEGLPDLVVSVEGYLEEASVFNLVILRHLGGLEEGLLSLVVFILMGLLVQAALAVFGPFLVQVDLLSPEAFGLGVLQGLVFLKGLQAFGSYSIVFLDRACSPALSLRRCWLRY